MTTQINIHCSSCGSEVEKVFDAKEGEGFKLTLFWCRRCGATEKPVGRECMIKPNIEEVK